MFIKIYGVVHNETGYDDAWINTDNIIAIINEAFESDACSSSTIKTTNGDYWTLCDAELLIKKINKNGH